MSGLLAAFLGFFEREFREFDFYLGMHDAYAEAGHRLERSGDEPSAQPSRVERLAMSTGGRFAVNTIAYEPPKHWGYFTLGTGIEVGGSVLPFHTRRNYFRLNLALQVGSLRTLINPTPAAVTFSLVGGPELEMLWWTSQVVQPMLGFRAGYQFGTADRFTARSCTSDRARGDARNCSQVVVQPYVAIALLERLRAQFTFVWFPQSQSFGGQRFDLLAGFGMHFF